MNGLLSVAMIVKNEERFLAECLRSVASLADDIIVVDTGSTDQSVAIARSFGARVVRIEWPDDFSQARNVGLDLVNTPWVLVVDADEELLADDVPALTQAITHPFADAYNLRIVSVMDRAEHISESYVLRLFRSHPQVRFEGKVHEQVFPALRRLNMNVAALNVRLLHKGYLGAVVEQRNKSARNRELLERQLREKPDDAYTLWQLAHTLLSIGELEEALSKIRQALKRTPVTHPLWVLEQITYARILESHGEHKRALRVLQEGQLSYPAYTDFYFLEGLISLGSQNWERAERAFRKCLELGEAQGFLMTETGVGSFKALFRLAQALSQQGKGKEALAYLLVTIQRYPSFRDAWQAIFNLMAGSTFDALLDTILLTVPLATVVDTVSQWQNLNVDESRLLEAARQRLASTPQNSPTSAREG
ncbi:MAG: glycosyltransferase [Firmicutes bacterium]|nr:glycosyltransferase [Bacillota bacterium]